MGVSIYYRCYRSYALSVEERKSISEIVERYSVKKQIEEYFITGKGWNGEDFCFYSEPLDSPEAILEGATGLPISTVAICCTAIEHWCNLLSEIRRFLPDSSWEVHVDDYEIPWNKDLHQFDIKALKASELQKNISFVKSI
jgi:hypothetical protein